MGATARKATLAVAGTALVLGTLAGCGSGDGGSGSSAPDNASTDEFCTAFNGLFKDVMAKAVASGDMSDAVSAIKEWAAKMQDVGTPSDMPDDARHGFEVFVEAAAGIPDDATLDDLQNLGGDLSQADQDAGDAFGTWAADNCPTALPDISDLPSDLASDLPTDLPTELPSEVPSELASMMSDLPTDPSELESMMSELTADAN